MILDRLCRIEENSKLIIKREQERVHTAHILKALLRQIDVKSEVVPDDNEKQIINLIQDLKGYEVNKNEVLIIEEIIGGKS